MTSVRQMLDCMGQQTLLRLMRARGLASERNNESRRSALARSYRGDVSQLVTELQRTELAQLFHDLPFTIKGVTMRLPSPGTYRVEQLRLLAVKAYSEADGPVPKVFVADPTAVRDKKVDAQSRGDDGGDPGDGALNPIKRSAAHRELMEKSIATLGSQWSRPVPVSLVLFALGHPDVERLHTTRFRSLLEALGARDIEVCLANDPENILTEDASSPGLTAKIMLRKRATPLSLHDHASHTHRDHDRSTTSIEVRAEPPVPRTSHRPADYNLALLKLQFLTAVPSVERRSLASWPGDYLDAATEGLALRPQELAVLKAYAQGLAFGGHSAFDAIPPLSQALSVLEWDALIDSFERLNSFQPEVVRVIIEEVSVFASPRAPVAVVAPQEAARPDKSNGVSASRGASAGAPKARQTAKSDEQSDVKNERSLGALDGMFDDE